MPELVSHPHTPSRVSRAVTVNATLTVDAKLSLHYELHGAVARMNIPAPGPARIGWKLWRHTCCELFLRQKSAHAYQEVNFSPSGEWAAYAFTRYREGAPLADESMNPQIAVRPDDEQLELSALVHAPPGALMLGLSVVVEEESGALSY